LIALEDRVLLSDAGSGLLQLPLSFAANVGQVGTTAQFVASGSGYGLALGSGDATLSLARTADDNGPATSDVVSMSLAGSSMAPAAQGLDPLPGTINYFLGTDPSQWRTNVPTFGKVQYGDIYPGIDLVYYGNQGQLEYDFNVKPGADPGQIALSFQGARSLSLDSGGNLILGTSGGNVVVHKPVVYQSVGGTNQGVAGSFELDGSGQVRFALGSYDHSLPLVIDPILAYSTYFGGSGNDQALAVAADGQGAAYITGSTLSTDLATTAGAVAPGSFIADLFKTTNAAGSWQGSGNGLPDADFATIAVDPRNSNVIYAATFSDRQAAQGIFKSTDGGQSWTAIDNGLTSQNVTRLVIDPVNTSNVYCTAGGFLFKSTDGGGHWNPLTGGLPNNGIGYTGLAIAPSNPNVLYVVSGAVQVYRTADGGSTWTAPETT
jgi:hypothetical protein